MTAAIVTVVVPSFNQGEFLDAALASIFDQELPVEVFVMDGGSGDGSLEVIKRWAPRLAGWRSHPDEGQAAAINEGVALGSAPYVCWLNSDDVFLPGGLSRLRSFLEDKPGLDWAYGRCMTLSASGKPVAPYITMPFWPWLFASFCFICQPGTLVRRTAWERLGGLRQELRLALDYELWWRLYRECGKPGYCRNFVAGTRAHPETKTATQVEQHYAESMAVVEEHWGRVPLKWRLFAPVMRWWRQVSARRS